MLTLTLKLLCLVTGLSLMSFVVFSYEDDERGAQSWLEQAWVKLHDLEKSASQRAVGAMSSLLQGTLSGLQVVFGHRLLSLRAFAASVCLCAAGFSTLVLLGGLTLSPNLLKVAFWGATACFFLWASSSRDDDAASIGAGLAVVGCTWALLLTAFADPNKYPPIEVRALRLFYASTLLAFALDGLAVAALRALLEKAALSTSLRQMLGYLAAASLVPVAVVLAISSVVVSLKAHLGTVDPALVAFVAQLNWAALLAGAIFSLAVVGAVVLRLVEALTPRLIYAAIKFKIPANRKVTASLAALLLSVWLPDAANTLEKVTKAVVQ